MLDEEGELSVDVGANPASYTELVSRPCITLAQLNPAPAPCSVNLANRAINTAQWVFHSTSITAKLVLSFQRT